MNNFEKNEQERNLGGLALHDIDGDDFLDVTFSRMRKPPIVYRNNGKNF